MLSGLGNLLRKRRAMRSGQSQRLQQDSSRLRAGMGDQAQAMQKAQGSAYGRAMNAQPQGPATNSLSRGATDNPQPQGQNKYSPEQMQAAMQRRSQGMEQERKAGVLGQSLEARQAGVQRLRQGAEMQKQGMAQTLSRMNTQPGSAPLRKKPLQKKPLRKKPGALSQGAMGNAMRGAMGAMAGGMNR